jgi:hypothetical protein
MKKKMPRRKTMKAEVHKQVHKMVQVTREKKSTGKGIETGTGAGIFSPPGNICVRMKMFGNTDLHHFHTKNSKKEVI